MDLRSKGVPNQLALSSAALTIAQHLALPTALPASIDGLHRAAYSPRIVLQAVATERLARVRAERMLPGIAAGVTACLAGAAFAVRIGLTLGATEASRVVF
jgi:hypothetical protein